MDLFKCQKCGRIVTNKGKRFFHFVKCDNCNQEYQLSEKGLWIYNLLPFICVLISVLTSIYIVRSDDIFIKCVVIIGGSYILYYVFSLFMIKKGLIKFEKRRLKNNGSEQ